MKDVKKITIVVFVIVCVMFALGRVYIMQKDSTAPVIESESKEIHVGVDYREQELLQGLSASDNRDGDITDEIMVGNISKFIETGVSKIKYVVFDENNNVGIYERMVYFDNYTSPKFELTQPLMYRLNSIVTLTDRLKAIDSIAGDISNKIIYSEDNINRAEEGTYQITVKVKNEYGDLVQEDLPVNIVPYDEYGERLQLSTYLVYLKKQSTINPRDYITKAVNLNGENVDPAMVNIIQQVDTSVAGSGQFRYELHDENGSTAVTFLTVIVTD